MLIAFPLLVALIGFIILKADWKEAGRAMLWTGLLASLLGMASAHLPWLH